MQICIRFINKFIEIKDKNMFIKHFKINKIRGV